MRTLVAASMLLLALPAFAEELDAKKAGEIQAEIDAKQAAVKKEYEGKKLSADERRELNRKLQDANNDVLKKHGTSDKDFSRATMTMDKASHAAMESSRREAAQKAAKKASEPKKDEKPAETMPVIEKGPGALKQK